MCQAALHICVKGGRTCGSECVWKSLGRTQDNDSSGSLGRATGWLKERGWKGGWLATALNCLNLGCASIFSHTFGTRLGSLSSFCYLPAIRLESKTTFLLSLSFCICKIELLEAFPALWELPKVFVAHSREPRVSLALLLFPPLHTDDQRGEASDQERPESLTKTLQKVMWWETDNVIPDPTELNPMFEEPA